jgi:signal peptidase I
MKSARLLSLFALSTVSVFAGIKSERQLAAIIDHTPAAHLVAEGKQLQTAEAAAANIPGAEAFWGIGESMEPLYATNTAIVVTPIAYDDVKKGMTVVYVKSNGRRVAHSIIGETRGGYLVQGVNNDEPDAEVVNEKNLIGVITAAYATSDSQFRTETTARLVAKGKIKSSNRT